MKITNLSKIEGNKDLNLRNAKVNCMHCGEHIANQHRDVGDIMVVPLRNKAIVLKSKAKAVRRIVDWCDDDDGNEHDAVLNIQLECLKCGKKTTHECQS